MRDAIASYVQDGDTLAIEGFTHLICFAAAHEIIRQRRRDLTLCRLTPDVIYDQMSCRLRTKLVFSGREPGRGSLPRSEALLKKGGRQTRARGVLAFGMVARFSAGGANTFWTRAIQGHDLRGPRPHPVRRCPSPAEARAVPALNPTSMSTRSARGGCNTRSGLLSFRKSRV